MYTWNTSSLGSTWGTALFCGVFYYFSLLLLLLLLLAFCIFYCRNSELGICLMGKSGHFPGGKPAATVQLNYIQTLVAFVQSFTRTMLSNCNGFSNMHTGQESQALLVLYISKFEGTAHDSAINQNQLIRYYSIVWRDIMWLYELNKQSNQSINQHQINHLLPECNDAVKTKINQCKDAHK